MGCFLFYQKTAYDLRISDWISDVCSSDLSTGRCLGLGQEQADLVERTGHRAYGLHRHPGVERGVLQLGMAEQRLDDADVDAILEQVRGEASPEQNRVGKECVSTC